jgi:ArsR family transcriptional regulator, arsenate/arsenite/antimonite-responsive transcriptional repressor
MRYRAAMETATPTRRPRTVVRPCCSPGAAPTLSAEAARRQAARFKALADPTRLQMLSLFANAGGEVCVCEVQEHFDLSQPTVSHHLKILREAGLVRCQKRGIWVHCALSGEGLAAVRDALDALRPAG